MRKTTTYLSLHQENSPKYMFITFGPYFGFVMAYRTVLRYTQSSLWIPRRWRLRRQVAPHQRMYKEFRYIVLIFHIGRKRYRTETASVDLVRRVIRIMLVRIKENSSHFKYELHVRGYRFKCYEFRRVGSQLNTSHIGNSAGLCQGQEEPGLLP